MLRRPRPNGGSRGAAVRGRAPHGGPSRRCAVSATNVNRYDVVVLDRDVPGLHGDTTSRMILDNADPAMVLMLTASAAPDERVTGLGLGAGDYIVQLFCRNRRRGRRPAFDWIVGPVRASAPSATLVVVDGKHLRAVPGRAGTSRRRELAGPP